MTDDQFRILAYILSENVFTVPEIEAETGLKSSSIRSALERAAALGRFVETALECDLDTERPLGRNGRPPKVYRLRSDRAEEAREEIERMASGLALGDWSAGAAIGAFADDEFRALAWDRLTDAVEIGEKEPERFRAALDHAAQLIQAERDRLADWEAAEHRVPDEIRREMQDLETTREALEIGVLQLAGEGMPDTISGLSDWIADAVVSWFREPLDRCAAAFAPLRLSPPKEEALRAEALSRQVRVMVRALTKMPGMAGDDLVIAAFAAISRGAPDPGAKARAALCRVADDLGHDRIARALHRWSAKLHLSDNPEALRILLRVLAAMHRDPSKLGAAPMAMWFDGLLKSRRLFSELCIYHYALVYPHAGGEDDLDFVLRYRIELERYAELAASRDPAWISAHDGLGLDPSIAVRNVRTWIAEAANVQSTERPFDAYIEPRPPAEIFEKIDGLVTEVLAYLNGPDQAVGDRRATAPSVADVGGVWRTTVKTLEKIRSLMGMAPGGPASPTPPPFFASDAADLGFAGQFVTPPDITPVRAGAPA